MEERMERVEKKLKIGRENRQVGFELEQEEEEHQEQRLEDEEVAKEIMKMLEEQAEKDV